MQTADYPEVTDDFGHWLAGFMDGEGCFQVGRRVRTPARAETYVVYQPTFAVSLRADDAAVLDTIWRRTGMGHVYRRGTYKESGTSRACPQATWNMNGKADCLRLVELLDRYPLRSRKARDYAIWRDAVLFSVTMQRQNTRQGGVRMDWSALAALRAQLMSGRAYSQ